MPCLAVIGACLLALHAHRSELAALGRGDGATDSGALRRMGLLAKRPHRFERIALFGDSLNMCTDPGTSRYDTLGRTLRTQIQSSGMPVEMVDLSQPGLWPLYFYALLDQTLALRVSLVVLEVNLRTFMDPLTRPGEERLPGLARKLGLAESLRVATSLEREGLSLLDPPLMRFKEQLGMLYVLEGARQAGLDRLHAAGEHVRTAFGLRRRTSPPFNEVARRAGLSYAVDYAAHPNAEVFRAIVADLRRAGIPFVAYVAPIDVETLRKGAGFDGADLERRIEELRQRVGASHVEWVDLHDALPASMFRDFQNHLRVSGCVRMARPIAQRVLHLLSRRPRQAPPVLARPAGGSGR